MSRETGILTGESPGESDPFRFLRRDEVHLVNLKGSVGFITLKSAS